MRRAALCGVVAVLLGSFGADLQAVTNVLVTSNNGVGAGTRIGVAVNLVTMGRACGMIGGVVVGQAPAGACPGTNTNGPIPPARTINVTDIAGNHVDADSAIVAALLGLKAFVVEAHSTSVTRGTFAQAELVDPIVFSDPAGGAFDVDLTRFFFEDSGAPGIRLAAQGPGSGSFHAAMSTDVTGFLFSLDLGFEYGQPLAVNLVLGAYLAGVAGWDDDALTGQLRTLLDASTADNDFSAASFEFPNIPVHVAAG